MVTAIDLSVYSFEKLSVTTDTNCFPSVFFCWRLFWSMPTSALILLTEQLQLPMKACLHRLLGAWSTLSNRRMGFICHISQGKMLGQFLYHYHSRGWDKSFKQCAEYIIGFCDKVGTNHWIVASNEKCQTNMPPWWNSIMRLRICDGVYWLILSSVCGLSIKNWIKRIKFYCLYRVML